jgi:hypothetical protein
VGTEPDSDNAIATAIAATCWPVIESEFRESESRSTESETACDSAGAIFSRSSKVIALIDKANNIKTTKTAPIPTRLTVSPSFMRL